VSPESKVGSIKKWVARVTAAGVIMYGCNENVGTLSTNGEAKEFSYPSCAGVTLYIPRDSENPKFDLIQKTKPDLGFDVDEPSNPDERGVIYQSCEVENHPEVVINNFVLLTKRDYGTWALRLRIGEMPFINRELYFNFQKTIIKAVYGFGDHAGDAQGLLPVLIESPEDSTEEIIGYNYIGFFVKKHTEWDFVWADEVRCNDTNSVWAISRGKHTPQESIRICNNIFVNNEDSPLSSERCKVEEITTLEIVEEFDMGCNGEMKDPLSTPPLSEIFEGEDARDRYFCGGLGNGENGKRDQKCSGKIEPWPIQELVPKLEEIIKEYKERK
jgi:hypothetical protein